MARNLSFWIKERHNPQLGVYYVPMGQMTVKAAKRLESPIYGNNYMLRFKSEDEYRQKLQSLRDAGEIING